MRIDGPVTPFLSSQVHSIMRGSKPLKTNDLTEPEANVTTFGRVPCYSYVRMSTKEQQKGVSERRQIEMAEAWASDRGMTLDSSLRDLGRSGYSGDHRKGALGIFLDAIKNGAVSRGSTLLIEAIDRLGREAFLDHMALFTSIVNAGVTIVTLEDGIEYSRDSISKNTGLIYILVGKIQQANQESQRKSDLVGDAWRKKKELAAQRVPMSKTCPAWLRLSDDRKNYEVLHDRAVIVERIFVETASGIGLDSISRRLNIDGIPPFSKLAQGLSSAREPAGWYSSYVKKIIVNRAVLGEYQPHLKNTKTQKRQVPVGEPVQGYFPAVISHQQWLAAQSAIALRRGTGGRTSNRISNLASGLCICALCGGKVGMISSGIRYPSALNPRKTDAERRKDWLVCDNARRGRGCTVKSRIRYIHIERALLASLVYLQFDDGAFPPKHLDHDGNDLLNRIARLKDKIAQDQVRLDTLVISFTDLSVFQSSIALLADRIKSNKMALEELIKEQSETQPLDEGFWDRIDDALNQNDQSDLVTRGRLQTAFRRVFDRIVCDPEKGFVEAVVFGGTTTIHINTKGIVEWKEFSRGTTRVRMINDGPANVGLWGRIGGKTVDIYRDGPIGRLISAAGLNRGHTVEFYQDGILRSTIQ